MSSHFSIKKVDNNINLYCFFSKFILNKHKGPHSSIGRAIDL